MITTMAIIWSSVDLKAFVLGLAFLSCMANGASNPPTSPDSAVFDVTKYGAKADGKTDNVEAFMRAWIKACRETTTAAKVLIPKGTFVVGPVVFAGPCKCQGPIVLEVQGTVKSTTDISEYTSGEWFSFEVINGLVITGDGTFDGQGPAVWKYNDCKSNKNCQLLPSSIKFSKVSNAVVEGITSLNSKSFHVYVYNCTNLKVNNVKIIAPDESPNTDGIHLSSCNYANITNTVIGTGDDCISIGQGTNNVFIKNVTCGPGHGISVGSLGKYPREKNVGRIFVSNCTLTNTTNGARIKTWGGDRAGEATTIVYDDIVMNNVKNPIIIDQSYGSRKKPPSKWKISDVHFRNIRGTTVSNVAVSIQCSSLNPCNGVELADIKLAYAGLRSKNTSLLSTCSNAKITTKGTLIPPPCVQRLSSLFNGEEESV